MKTDDWSAENFDFNKGYVVGLRSEEVLTLLEEKPVPSVIRTDTERLFVYLILGHPLINNRNSIVPVNVKCC